MRRLPVFAAGGILFLVSVWALTPPGIDSPFKPLITITPDLSTGPREWVRRQNELVDSAYGIVAGAEQRILWQQKDERSEYVLVYLHGFSASRQEIAPVPELVAERLGANLFEARLTGHGLETSQMENVRAEQWIQDAVTALEIEIVNPTRRAVTRKTRVGRNAWLDGAQRNAGTVLDNKLPG